MTAQPKPQRSLFKPENWLETATDVKLEEQFSWLNRWLDAPATELWSELYALRREQSCAIWNEMQARKTRRARIAA